MQEVIFFYAKLREIENEVMDFVEIISFDFFGFAPNNYTDSFSCAQGEESV